MIHVVIGTRPEAIKLAPVVAALRARGAPVRLIATGQQGALLDDTLRALHLTPDARLEPLPHALPDALAALLVGLRPQLVGGQVLVHGDTTSALAAALVGFYAGLPVAHVEAGLRTGDPARPFPEETHRVLIDRLSSRWFAPTEAAEAALLREGCAPDRVHLVGNPVVDALHAALGEARPWAEAPLPAEVIEVLSGAERVALVTCHRRESHGAPMARVAQALTELSRDHRVLWVRHPHPAARAAFEVLARVIALPPLPPDWFARLLARADVVLTDSGGVQEEAVALGRRALVLRDETERPEGVSLGLLELVGTDPARIVEAARRARTAAPAAPCPYGDGRAGERIAALLWS